MKVNARVFTLVLSAVLIIGLAACGGSNQAGNTGTDSSQAQTQQQAQSDANEEAPEASGSDSGQDHQEITFYLWGEKPNQMDDVMNHFNETGGKELNMTWKTNWTPLDDYANSIKLRLSAGEPVDACFDAQWLMMLDFIREGNYRDMGPYFQNPKYPGLLNSFDANYLDANQLGTGSNYGVPFAQAFGVAPLVFIRGDLREQYGIPPVKSLADYEVFLEAIRDNEPNMFPVTTSVERNTSTITNHENSLYTDVEAPKAGVWYDLYIASGVHANAYVKDYQLVDVALSIEPAGAYAAFPAPFNQRNIGMDYKLGILARDHFERGFLDPDFLTVSSMAGIFTSGKAASMIWDTANYLTIVNTTKLALPDATIEVYQPDPVYREGTLGQKKGIFNAWNFICVPVTTPEPKFDRIMQFFNWMFSSWENHDLIELGISGKHFEPVGENQFKIPDGVDPATNYNLPGYQLTWNPNFIRLSADMPDDVVLYNQRANNPDTYFDQLFSGFAFDPTGVETALANPDMATAIDRASNIRYGIIPNVVEAFAALDADMESNRNLMSDIESIKEELRKQIQEFLNERKVKDESRGVKW